MWGKAQKHGEARLLDIEYFTRQGATMTGGAWQQWWGWMGLVPKGVRGKVGLGEVKLVLATAKVLTKAGRDMWDARNEVQQRWELGLGITERKGEVRRREWKGVPSGKARGRPKMAPEDLSVTYRLKLEGEDNVGQGTEARGG